MIKHIIMFVGVYTLVMCFVRIVLALMGDRTGNSGRKAIRAILRGNTDAA